MSEEQITITMSFEQAAAVVDACNCMELAADGELADLVTIYAPDDTTVSATSDRYRRSLAKLAQEVADMLRPEIDSVYNRDPQLQDFIHQIKMDAKYGRRPED